MVMDLFVPVPGLTEGTQDNGCNFHSAATEKELQIAWLASAPSTLRFFPPCVLGMFLFSNLQILLC